MKVKTSELEGIALDWAVAKAIGFKPFSVPFTRVGTAIWAINDSEEIVFCNYSKSWEQCGPLIEKYQIVYLRDGEDYVAIISREGDGTGCGNNHLIATCRAIVASLLGDEVEIPDELF